MFGILKGMANKHMTLPIVLGVIIASLIILGGYLFVTSTHSRVQTTQNTIVRTHNQVAQLPQPEDIDLGVPSGSIAGQLESYRRATNEYTDLSFNAPSHARQKVAGWMTFSAPSSPPISPEELAAEYKEFTAVQLQLLTILEKPLVYDPHTDLYNLDTNSDEFLQRAINAGEGLKAAQQKVRNTELPPETKEAVNHELDVLTEANKTFQKARSLDDWSRHVTSTQQTIRGILQNYWADRIEALTQSKQQLVEHYSHLYQ